MSSGFNVTKLSNVIRGFGGGSTVSEGLISESLIVDGCPEENVRFRVVNDDTLPFNVIIGRNYTDSPQLAYYRCDDKFEFVAPNDFPFELYPEIETRERNVESTVVTENVIIPPASINFINVKINDKEMFLDYENASKNEIILKKSYVLNSVIEVEETVPEIKLNRRQVIKNDLSEDLPLSVEQFDEFLSLINKYRMCVALDTSELGCTHLLKVDIIEKPGSEPVYAKPYSTNAEKHEIMREKVR